jgi:hypothetical protein
MHRQDAVPAGMCDPLPLPPVRALQPALLQGSHSARVHAYLLAQLKGKLKSMLLCFLSIPLIYFVKYWLYWSVHAEEIIRHIGVNVLMRA